MVAGYLGSLGLNRPMRPRQQYSLILVVCIVTVGISIYLSQPLVLPLSLGFLAATIGIVGFRAGRSPALRVAFFNSGVVAWFVILVAVRFIDSRDAPITAAAWPNFLQLVGCAWGVWCLYHLIAPSVERKSEP